MLPLPVLQARTMGGPVVSLPMASMSSVSPALLQRQISASAQTAQAAAAVAAQAATSQETNGASAESLKAHASTLKV